MIRRPADHHPEREVAAYVSGEMSPKDLRRFEAHLLECELCWQEVQLNREGRRLAESSREPAPASLREDVRAAVALSVGRRRHRRPMFIALGSHLMADAPCCSTASSRGIASGRYGWTDATQPKRSGCSAAIRAA